MRCLVAVVAGPVRGKICTGPSVWRPMSYRELLRDVCDQVARVPINRPKQ